MGQVSGSIQWRVAVVCCILAIPAAAQDAAAQIQAEIQRVRRSLQERPITDPNFASNNANTETLLKGAAGAAGAGQLYLSLERLGQAADFVRAAGFYVANAPAISGMPAFDAEWNKANVEVNTILRDLANHTAARAAIRAMSESARGKTQPLLEGSRGFAVATGPKDGLFYMGEALAQAERARFLQSVRLPRGNRPVALRSLLPDLQALQDQVNAAFQPPRSITLHDRFIALNATLKTARESDAARFYAAALYQYLDAQRRFATLDSPPVDDAAKSELKQAVAAAARKLEASRQDDSIAQIFVQRAASQVAHPDGSEPTPDEWRSARAIVDTVLPAYYAALKTAPLFRTTAGKTVQITLVRWPYT